MYASASGNAAILRRLILLGCSCEPPTVMLADDRAVAALVGDGPAQAPGSKVMLSSGLSPPTVRPARGRGPLHLAAEAGHTEVCTLIVNLGGGRLEQRSDEGLTPLMTAC